MYATKTWDKPGGVAGPNHEALLFNFGNWEVDLRGSMDRLRTQALYFNIVSDVNDTSLPVRVNNRGVNDHADPECQAAGSVRSMTAMAASWSTAPRPEEADDAGRAPRGASHLPTPGGRSASRDSPRSAWRS